MSDLGRMQHLACDLTLAAAHALWDQLHQQLEIRQPVLLDGEAVERASTACLQVLVAARRAARERGIGFELHAPSVSLLAAIASLGLGPALLTAEA